MEEYMDILLTIGKDFLAYNKNEYEDILSQFRIINDAQISKVNNNIEGILSER